MKTNPEIEAAPEDFHAALERARQAFGRIDGVLSVGFGRKRTGDVLTERVAIMVFVREKKPRNALAPADRIPESFEGYPTDVRVVGRGHAEACDNENAYGAMAGGIQIEIKHSSSTTGQGTLGCIVKKREYSGRENVYLLTNKHVLYSEDLGLGNTVYHPKMGDTALGPVADGFYENVRYPRENAAAPDYFIDCGIARIDLDSTCCCCTCTQDSTHVSEAVVIDLDTVNGDNTLKDVRSVIGDVLILSETVYKVGRTTGPTRGHVTAVGAPLVADPPPDNAAAGNVAATNLIEIKFDITSTPTGNNCKGNPNFTEQGDSGSLVVDEGNRAIGLHTHGHVNPTDHIKYSYACHILPVLDYLGICIPCVVVPSLFPSHGNSLATDGSGVAPRALPAAESTVPVGAVVFTGAGAARSPPVFAPLVVTAEETAHMRALLADFRRTPLGPEIHEMFGHVRREIAYLVRNVRPVKVAWARNQGPAFLIHVLNHVIGHTASVPHEVKGVTRRQLLTRMREVLAACGSNLLRESLERHGDELLDVFTDEDCDSVTDCIARLHATELA